MRVPGQDTLNGSVSTFPWAFVPTYSILMPLSPSALSAEAKTGPALSVGFAFLPKTLRLELLQAILIYL